MHGVHDTVGYNGLERAGWAIAGRFLKRNRLEESPDSVGQRAW